MVRAKVRAVLGPDAADDKEVVILGRVVRWQSWGVEFEADPRHRQILTEHFGFGAGSSSVSSNGEHDKKEQEGDEEEMSKEDARTFRGAGGQAKLSGPGCPGFAISREGGRAGYGQTKVGQLEEAQKSGQVSLGPGSSSVEIRVAVRDRPPGATVR